MSDNKWLDALRDKASDSHKGLDSESWYKHEWLQKPRDNPIIKEMMTNYTTSDFKELMQQPPIPQQKVKSYGGRASGKVTAMKKQSVFIDGTDFDEVLFNKPK